MTAFVWLLLAVCGIPVSAYRRESGRLEYPLQAHCSLLQIFRYPRPNSSAERLRCQAETAATVTRRWCWQDWKNDLLHSFWHGHFPSDYRVSLRVRFGWSIYFIWPLHSKLYEGDDTWSLYSRWGAANQTTDKHGHISRGEETGVSSWTIPQQKSFLSTEGVSLRIQDS